MLEERGFDESWARFLATFFTRQEGMNYRNELLHGSVDEVSEGTATIVLIAVLFMAIGLGLGPPENDTSDGQPT
jgi:hypothetical protein